MFSSTDLAAKLASRRGWLKGAGSLLAGGLLFGKSQPAAARAGLLVASPQGLEPFLAEIMLVSFNFPPKGWAFCNGQLLPINQNQALFSLLGITYGGNGQTNFALPDMRGRVPVHFDGSFDAYSKFSLGRALGETAHTLTATEMVPHTHGYKVSSDLGNTTLSGSGLPAVPNYLADNGGGSPQYGGSANVSLAADATSTPKVNITSSLGGSQPHNNMQPYLCLNYVIALQGIFPSRT